MSEALGCAEGRAEGLADVAESLPCHLQRTCRFRPKAPSGSIEPAEQIGDQRVPRGHQVIIRDELADSGPSLQNQADDIWGRGKGTADKLIHPWAGLFGVPHSQSGCSRPCPLIVHLSQLFFSLLCFQSEACCNEMSSGERCKFSLMLSQQSLQRCVKGNEYIFGTVLSNVCMCAHGRKLVLR